MVDEEDGTDKRLGQARNAQQPTVTDAVVIRMRGLLKGKVSGAPLTAKELAETAKALIADMGTRVAPDVQSDDENWAH